MPPRAPLRLPSSHRPANRAPWASHASSLPPRRPFLTSLFPGGASSTGNTTAASSSSSSPFPSLPPPPPQHLQARRRLPYRSSDLFRVIADVDSYARFVPYCVASKVTAWTTAAAAAPPPSASTTTTTTTNAGASAAGPSADGTGPSPPTRWPARATLRVGFGSLTEDYGSVVVCAPAAGVVEALSGAEARSGLGAAELEACGHGALVRGGGGGEDGPENGIFRSLVTRWTVRALPPPPSPDDAQPPGPRSGGGAGDAGQTTPPSPKTGEAGEAGEWSDVELSIRFQFASPLYAAVSAAVADRVAGVMIEAFERRVGEVLGAGSSSRKGKVREEEGVGAKAEDGTEG